MEEYNIFLDDDRIPYSEGDKEKNAYCYTKDEDYKSKEWIVIREYDRFIDVIESMYVLGDFPTLISFDHDLGKNSIEEPLELFGEKKEKSGELCAKWLINFCQDKKIKVPDFKVHSANTCGADNITSWLNNLKKHQEKYGL